jgi:hypothetical protein
MWDRIMTNLRFEFHDLAEELATGIDGLRVTVNVFQGIDFEKYRLLRQGKPTERTWMFGVNLRYGESALRFVFWAAHRYPQPMDPVDPLTDDPALLVSLEEQKGRMPAGHRSIYKKLDDLEEDRFSLREIVVHKGHLARRRFNPVAEESEWDLECTPTAIVKDFYEEALQALLLT